MSAHLYITDKHNNDTIFLILSIVQKITKHIN